MTMFEPSSKHHVHNNIALFFYNHKDLTKVKTSCSFISRLIILYAARKLKRIEKLINQPMQCESKVHKTE
jgi:hypothetical protein